MACFLSFIEIYGTRPELSYGQVIPRKSLADCFEYIYSQIEHYVLDKFGASIAHTEFDPEIEEFYFVSQDPETKRLRLEEPNVSFDAYLRRLKNFLIEVQFGKNLLEVPELKIRTLSEIQCVPEHFVILNYDSTTKKLIFKHISSTMHKMYIFQVFNF